MKDSLQVVITAARVQAQAAGFLSAVRSCRRIRLSQGEQRSVRFLSGAKVSLPAGKTESWVTITRTGTFHDPRYGEFSITPTMLAQMVQNFDAGILGVDIFIDAQHRPENGAAAKFKSLKVEGDRLRALVQWLPYGADAVKNKCMVYLSAEYVEDFIDNEKRQSHGPTLLGAGLTTRPVISRLDPVDPDAIELSHESLSAGPTLLHPQLVRQLSQDWSARMDKHLKALLAALTAMTLSQDTVDSLAEAYKLAAGNLGDDDDKLKALAQQFEATGKKLAAAKPGERVTLSIEGLPTAPQSRDPQSATPEQIEAMVSKQLAKAREAEETAARKLAQDTTARRKVFTDAVDAAEGLSDETKSDLKKQLSELITPEMSEDQVKRLAEYQISQAHNLEAARQLAQQGYQDTRTGAPRITVDESNGIKRLSSEIRKNLAGTSAAMKGEIRLVQADKLPAFAQKVLSCFDQLHGRRLDAERRIMLSEGGNVQISDTDLPVSFMREVITEVFADNNVMNLIQTLTDLGATGTTQIPYEEQGDASSIPNDGVVYEGRGIPRSGVRQKMDLAYILPMKLAMTLTVEVMHFTRTSQINWEAWGRNMASNARIIRELIARRILNELQRVADAYGAATVTDEAVHAQLDGNNSIITLAEFPLVRPFQQYDMQGETVGAVENPITISITVGGSPVSVTAWDGTGTQAAGTYYRVVNYNLSKIQLVDEDGDPLTPTATASAVSYSHATNVQKFVLDVPGDTTLERHLNGLLQAVGARKATMNAELRGLPNYQFMSPVLNDIITNAENFTAQARRDGANTSAQGDLETIKGIPAWSTNAAGVDLGDHRILMGQRGMLSYVVAKPFSVDDPPSDARDSDGRFTGEKEAYGVEFSAIKVPKPLRKRHTSVIAYNAADREAYEA